MKKTFYSILSKTYKKNNLWNYYNASHEFGKDLPVKTEQLSKDFLKNFIKISGKAEQTLYKQIDDIGVRSTHVVSTFLIGHYVYQNTILKELIDKEIGEIKKQFCISADVEFTYLWFLTCLFHDLGYNIENSLPVYSDYNDLKQKTGELVEIIGIPPFYQDIVKNYFEYRLKCCNKNDHGIVAGHMLFKDLCGIRELADANRDEQEFNWSIELNHIYNFCAWNIVAHNIWYANTEKESDIKKYEEAGLSDLILEKIEDNIQYQIKAKVNPFLFLFCLVDTLEPYKRLTNISLLKKVSLEICNEKSTIVISTNLKCAFSDVIFEQAKGLNNWLTSSKSVGNKVEIKLAC
jgi:hypothetical protein